MDWIVCTMAHLDAVSAMYERVVRRLQATVNYPGWSENYPCRETVRAAIRRGDQFACLEDGRVLGAAVLNADPNGDYDAGDWTQNLRPGEYLVIHTLAADPSSGRRGVGGYMVDRCAEAARRRGARALRLDVVPGNLPAIRLYLSRGFRFAGARDLKRPLAGIPLYELYELNL